MNRELLDRATADWENDVVWYYLPDTNEYVTWLERKDSPGSTYNGRYYPGPEGYEKSQADFEKRQQQAWSRG